MHEERQDPNLSDLEHAHFSPTHVFSPEDTLRAVERFTRSTELIEAVKARLGPGYLPNESEVMYLCHEIRSFAERSLAIGCLKSSEVWAPLHGIEHVIGEFHGERDGNGAEETDDKATNLKWNFKYQDFLQAFVEQVRRSLELGLEAHQAQVSGFVTASHSINSSALAYFSPNESGKWLSYSEAVDHSKQFASTDTALLVLNVYLELGLLDSSLPHELNEETHNALRDIMVDELVESRHHRSSEFDLRQASNLGFGYVVAAAEMYDQMKVLDRLEQPQVRKAIALQAVQEYIGSYPEQKDPIAKALARFQQLKREGIDSLSKLTALFVSPAVVKAGEASIARYEYFIAVITEFNTSLQNYFS
jgi:hypothetical protein